VEGFYQQACTMSSKPFSKLPTPKNKKIPVLDSIFLAYKNKNSVREEQSFFEFKTSNPV